MTAESLVGRKGRLSRILRLLKRLRPAALPVTYRDNRVLLFPGGTDFFRSLHTALGQAKEYILIEFYLIRNDRTGAALAEELVRAAGRGVSVRLVYDAIGSLETPASFFAALARQGVEVVPFNVPSFRRGLRWFDRRDHRKLVVIDGSLAYLGGFNIGDEYSGRLEGKRRFRDVGFSISGDAVGELVREFSEIWQLEQPEPPTLPTGRKNPGDDRRRQGGSAAVVIVSGGPHQRRSYIGSAFLVNIAAASEEILIATPYFVPGPRILRALLRAARRGVQVSLLLPARSDVPVVRLLGRSFYGALLRQGIAICELDGEILHAKVMLIDRERTILGSANLDQRSFHRNFEINCIIDDGAFGGQIRRLFLKDFRKSRPITLGDYERRGLVARFLERVINLFARFL
ncbi:MAG: phospholipase D-like domain-containing protein [Deltaproteobacteria bacterium]|nr:phospholipase D-like domain-containing protein [Deltaproteobacteria bacterium]